MVPDFWRSVLVLRKYRNLSRFTYGWRRGVVVSGVRHMNEVNARRARLLLGWVTN